MTHCRLVFVLLLATRATADDIGDSIEQLGACRFAEREAAQARLVELAAGRHEAFLQRAVKEFVTTRDPEIRERLREVMRAVMERELFGRPQGFLGIRMGSVFVVMGDNAAEFKSQIQVVGLTEDSAAEKAGVQVGDVIIGMDGRPLAAEAPQQKFVEQIRSQPPGTEVRLQVVREGVTREIPVRLGAMPPTVQAELYPPDRKRALFEEWLDRAVRESTPPAEPKIDKPPRAR
jgi:predicted metalloprotease with PDZ domain